MDINSYLEGFRDGYEKAVRTARPIGLIEDAMRKQLLNAPDHIVMDVFKNPEAENGKRPAKNP